MTDILICTVVDEAEVAVNTIFGLNEARTEFGYKFQCGHIVTAGGETLRVLNYQLERFNLGAAAALTAIVLQLKPRVVIVPDIGGGVAGGSENPRLGDVVASRHVTYYAAEKIEEDPATTPATIAMSPRTTTTETPSPMLLQLVRLVAAKNEWQEAITSPSVDADRRVRLLHGEFLSGEAIRGAETDPVLLKLLKDHPKALVVETEGGGVGKALLEVRTAQIRPEFLILRSISDYVNEPPEADRQWANNQATRDQWKKYAADCAAAAALAVVRLIEPQIDRRSRVAGFAAEYVTRLRPKLRPDPAPVVEFAVPAVAVGSSVLNSPGDLLDRTLAEQRILLRGGAGAGKTFLLSRVTEEALSRDLVLIFINLKRWTKQVTERFVIEETSANLPTRMEELLRLSITDIKEARIREFLGASHSVVLVVDALNEVFGSETAQRIISVLDEYVRLSEFRLSVLISDRVTERFTDDNWVVANVRPLSEDAVTAAIDSKF